VAIPEVYNVSHFAEVKFANLYGISEKNCHDIVAEVSNVSKKPLPILKKIADTRRLERSIECYWYFPKFEQL